MNLFARRIGTTLLLRHDLQAIGTAFADGNFVIEVLDQADADLLSQVNPDIDRALEIAKFAAGLTCYVARADGRLAHYSWVQDSGRHLIGGAGRKRRVREGDLWIHACFTAAWARGRHLYPAVLGRILQDYKARGFRTAWIYVLDSNLASQQGIRRAGFELVSRLRSLSVRGWNIPLL